NVPKRLEIVQSSSTRQSSANCGRKWYRRAPMPHGKKENMLTKQTHCRPSPFGLANLTFTNSNSLNLCRLPECFCHQILQPYEYGPPPCQCSSVVGVIEVGALSREAARSLMSNIDRC